MKRINTAKGPKGLTMAFVVCLIFIAILGCFSADAMALENEEEAESGVVSKWIEKIVEEEINASPIITLDEESGEVFYLPKQNYFIWPYDGELSSYFGYRDDVYVGSNDHQGIDIMADYGDEVVAARAGVVTEDTGWDGGYGLCVHIDHEDGMESLYAHNCEILVEPGDYVEAGDVIAYTGMTGWSSGTHVHFEVRYMGIAIDPLDFLPELE